MPLPLPLSFLPTPSGGFLIFSVAALFYDTQNKNHAGTDRAGHWPNKKMKEEECSVSSADDEEQKKRKRRGHQGKRCLYPGCSSASNKDKDLSFYTFPKPGIERNQFCLLVNVDKTTVQDHYRICSKHFPDVEDGKSPLRRGLLNLFIVNNTNLSKRK